MMFRPAARFLLSSACAVALVLAVSCSKPPTSPTPQPPTGGTGGGGGNSGSTGQTVVVLAVGDIGMCNAGHTAPLPAVTATAKLVASLQGILLLAGDIAYLHGSAADFRDCFDPAWGQFRSRWHAVPGNHEYESTGAGPYFDYFGEAAGPQGLGYYSVTIGDWQVLMLNSNIAVGRGSAQWEFVRQQLQLQRTPCTMAVWHHPLFTSGPNGPNANMRDMWALLETANVELVVNGHDHLYERFARQTADGTAEPAKGIRQLTVGTGGAELYSFVRTSANSEFRLAEHGVMRLTLQPAAMQWEFLTTAGRSADQGLDTCR